MCPFIKSLNIFRRSYHYYFLLFLFFLNVGLSIFFSIGLFGTWRIFTNTSNSMLPTINQGSLSIIERHSPTSYDMGDIITFYANINNREEIVTHRVYKIGGNVYLTKGDNNEAIDPDVVRPRLIIGQVIGNIPYLGYWVSFLKSGLGNFILIIIPAIIFIAFEIINIYQIRPNS